MTPLSPLDLDLLYFLCSASHHRCRVVRVKASRAASLRRLRYAGLISLEGFAPSPSAIGDWIERRNQTPARGPIPELTEPPVDGGNEGGGAIRSSVAPSPKRPGPPSMAERARRFEEQRKAKANKPHPARPKAVVEPHGRHRADEREAGHGAVTPAAQPRLIAKPTPPKVDLKVNSPRDPTQPPDTPMMDVRDAQVRRGHRHAAAVNRGHEQAATALVDAGVDPASQNSITSARMRAVLARRENDARLACPVEQAKTKLRRRYTPVCGAEVSGGPKGKFYVGRKLVSEAELLAMAGRMG